MPQWKWLVQQLVRRIWFRAAVIAVAAILLALSAPILANIVPWSFALKVDAGSVGTVLNVLATSMLAVTTFSITIMVTAFSGAAQNGTPRATELLVEDAAAQNALSTFLGSFLFGVVSIIALEAGFYDERGRVVLLVASVVVIAIIALVLLQWISQLTQFGRVGDTIRRVERRACRAIADYPGPLTLSGKPVHQPSEDALLVVRPEESGYVAHVDRARLSKIAQEAKATVHVAASAGEYVDRTRPLCSLHNGSLPDTITIEEELSVEDAVRKAFRIEWQRDFDQDPRFGVVVLAEIASRALSPGINDPGTAIAALSSGMRIFEHFVDQDVPGPELVPGLIEPPLSLFEMVEDLVAPIARDAGKLVEVHKRIQHLLGSLAREIGSESKPFEELAARLYERALGEIEFEHDRNRLEKARRQAFG